MLIIKICLFYPFNINTYKNKQCHKTYKTNYPSGRWRYDIYEILILNVRVIKNFFCVIRKYESWPILQTLIIIRAAKVGFK